MSLSYRYAAARQAGAYTWSVGGLGVRGGDIPATGLHGPAIQYPGLVLPAEANDEFMYRVVTAPPLLTLFRYDAYGRVQAEGPDGTHAGVYEGRKNGVVYGQAPFYVLIGVGGSFSGGVTAADAVASGSLAMVPAPTPSPAPPSFVPRRNVTLSYSAVDLAAVPDLTAKDPAETVRLVADFTPFTPLSSPLPTWVISRVGGDDGTANPTMVGSPTFVGNQVQQLVQGGTPGNTYSLRCEARGPNGETLVAAGRLPVRARP